MTQLPPRLAAFHVDGADRIGVVTDAGIIDLTADFGTRFAGLKEVIEGGAIPEMLAAAEGRQHDYTQDQVRWLIPIANPEKLICIGVNFPDRNAEYKDGQEAPAARPCSSAFPAALSGMGKIWCARPKALSWTMRAR
jgi:2-keto-4-pentenoate hydratase/2-oxohepta-3-ene-1,7-dioic acid hydratase in catechol pathway